MPTAPPPSPALKNILSLLAMLTAAVVAAFGAAPSGTEPAPPVPPATTPTATQAPVADPCVAPAGMDGLRDQDPEDEQTPWKRTPGQKAVISIDKTRVATSPEWVEYLEGAAKKWNVSPCVDVRIVTGCPPDAGCVKFDVVTKGDDGNFDEVNRGGFNYGGQITVNSKLRGARINTATLEPCSQRFNVVIHEVGHAIGLRHVRQNRVIMNEETYPDVCAIDLTAMNNLAYSYTRLQK